jgi:hypothetical protein
MELMVSLGIFILLGVLLVSLMHSGVQLWSKGEVRRDSFERAATLFDAFRADFSCATIHREPDKSGFHPNFTCVPDPSGRPRVWFTRVGAPTRAVPMTPTAESVKNDTVYYEPANRMQRHQIFYCFHPDADSAQLFRGQALFDRDFGTLPNIGQFFNDPAAVTQQCSLLSDGVIYLGFRFWSQKTRMWNPTAGEPGPETRWDSTRWMDKSFPLYRRNLLSNDVLDDILPHRVEVTVTLERPGAALVAASRLSADVTDTSRTLPADILASFPREAGWARIDNEWIRYAKASGTALVDVERGQRGTTAADHTKGAAIRWGDTFTTVISVPAFKDDDHP